MITIKKPYVYHIAGDKVRLAAQIADGNGEKELYFEVEEKYGSYLVEENTDAFVFSLLYYCMHNQQNIVCEAPMTERLYYQLTNYFIPIMSCNDPMLAKINVKAELICWNTADSKLKARGCSVSGGVDSFYTIIKHMNCLEENYRLSHLVIGNVFGRYEKEEEKNRERYRKLLEKNQIIAKEMELPLVSIYTNIYEWFYPHYPNYHSLRTMSMILALKKMFSIYYFSNTYSLEDFNIVPESHDSADYDLLNVSIISDDGLTFYTSGTEMSRAEKTEYICDSQIVKRYLHVCNIQNYNCSRCSKCKRTLTTLWTLDKLNNYKEIFDIEYYKREHRKTLITMVARKNPYDREIFTLMKKKGKTIPPVIKVLGSIKRLWVLLLGRINRVDWVRKIYYALNIDIIRFGRDEAVHYRYEHTKS